MSKGTGRAGRSVLHCSIFCSVGGRIQSLAFALGLGAATAFMTLLVVASSVLRLGVMSHLLLFVVMFGGIAPPWIGDSPQLAILGALLLWVFSISLAVLGVSSIVAFQKMAHEAKGMGKLRLAFGAGIVAMCTPFGRKTTFRTIS